MPGFFETRIDTAWTRVGLFDRGAGSKSHRDVGNGGLDWLPVRQVTPRPYNDVIADGNAKSLGNEGTWLLSPNSDAVDAGRITGLLSFNTERGFALVTVPACEPIRGQSPNRRTCLNKNTTTVFGDHKPLAAQLLDCLPDSHARYTEMLNQVRFGRKPLAGRKLVRLDGCTQNRRDLTIGRTVVRLVDPVKLQHVSAFHGISRRLA